MRARSVTAVAVFIKGLNARRSTQFVCGADVFIRRPKAPTVASTGVRVRAYAGHRSGAWRVMAACRSPMVRSGPLLQGRQTITAKNSGDIIADSTFLGIEFEAMLMAAFEKQGVM